MTSVSPGFLSFMCGAPTWVLLVVLVAGGCAGMGLAVFAGVDAAKHGTIVEAAVIGFLGAVIIMSAIFVVDYASHCVPG